MEYWQDFVDATPDQAAWTGTYPAPMPDGRRLVLPLRDFGDVAVAGLIVNQAAFTVLDQLAAWTAAATAAWQAEVVLGLPTLGHTVGAAVARSLGHPGWVAPSTTRKRWYDDALSAPLASITSPVAVANALRRMWLDLRRLPRLHGRRVLLVDDVISTGSSALAGLALLRAAGIAPVGLAVTMIQGDVRRAAWPAEVPVAKAFGTTRFRRVGGAWGAIDAQSCQSPQSRPAPAP